jgi:hypothetical protein
VNKEKEKLLVIVDKAACHGRYHPVVVVDRLIALSRQEKEGRTEEMLLADLTVAAVGVVDCRRCDAPSSTATRCDDAFAILAVMEMSVMGHRGRPSRGETSHRGQASEIDHRWLVPCWSK